MEYPSNIHEELSKLREHIKQRLQVEANRIINAEIEKILGRVKIITMNDLRGNYEWFIEKPQQVSE